MHPSQQQPHPTHYLLKTTCIPVFPPRAPYSGSSSVLYTQTMSPKLVVWPRHPGWAPFNQNPSPRSLLIQNHPRNRISTPMCTPQVLPNISRPSDEPSGHRLTSSPAAILFHHSPTLRAADDTLNSARIHVTSVTFNPWLLNPRISSKLDSNHHSQSKPHPRRLNHSTMPTRFAHASPQRVGKAQWSSFARSGHRRANV
jgi:hypothetical protein